MTQPKNVHAFTETEGYQDYPAYISVNREGTGYQVTVRTRDHHNLVASINLTPVQLAELGRALVAAGEAGG